MSACIFCRIAAGEIPSDVVHRDDLCVAFRDIEPRAPIHILIVPRRHVASLADLTADDAALAGHLQLTAARLAAEAGLTESGYRVVVNCGDDGGQTVPHLHVHLLGGRRFEWPPG
jgi:histidine triad (HIT) family protein